MISKKLSAALSVAALAVSGSVAFAGAAGATVTQAANGVTYGTGGSPAATYDSSTGSWTLESPTSTGASAQIDLYKPAAPSASTAPSFNASAYAAGDPRWVIEFHNGCYLFGTPTAAGSSTFTWAVNPGGNQNTDWATALAAAQACGTDDQVTAAFIVDDTGSGGTPSTLTNVTYNGNSVVPVSNSGTQTPLGEISNANSGKCLDVTGGVFADGTPLQQWTCGAKSPDGVVGGDQQFEVVTRTLNGTETGSLTAISPTGSVFYVNASGGQLTLSSSKSATTDMLKSGPYYTFPEAPNSTSAAPIVMDVKGASTTNGAAVIGYPLHSSTNQQWSLP